MKEKCKKQQTKQKGEEKNKRQKGARGTEAIVKGDS